MEQMKTITHTTQIMIGPSSPDIGKKLLKAVTSNLTRTIKMINPKTAIINLNIPLIIFEGFCFLRRKGTLENKTFKTF